MNYPFNYTYFSIYIIPTTNRVMRKTCDIAVISKQFISPWISQIGRWSGDVGDKQVVFRVVRTTVRDKRKPVRRPNFKFELADCCWSLEENRAPQPPSSWP